MIAVGVARPSASGQVITTTVIANSSAVCTPAPTASQTAKVRVPPISATSTSQNAARSASRCPGALEFCASCTSATICARAVSAPTLVARTRSVPEMFTDAPMTCAPGVLRHRQAFPGDHRLVDLGVALLDDAVDGDLRPGPDQQQVADLDVGGGDLDLVARRARTTALGGASSSSDRIASLAPPRARISNQCPSSTNAVRTVAAS